MPIALARSLVAAPNRTPLPFGLLSVAQQPADGDDHWQNGITFQSESCGPVHSTVDPCPTPPADKTPSTTDKPAWAAEAVTLYTWVDCDDFGSNGAAEAEARRALEWGEGYALERIVWTGQVFPTGAGVTIEPHLAANNFVVSDGAAIQIPATIVTGTGQKLKLALGLLEEALADCYKGQGVIHVPARLGPFLGDGIVFQQGNQLVTRNGHLIALGAGYTGSSPAAAAATTTATWIYATGAVMARRTPITVPDFPSSFNRSKNDLVMIAERTYSVAWECCHLAIPVNLETS